MTDKLLDAILSGKLLPVALGGMLVLLLFVVFVASLFDHVMPPEQWDLFKWLVGLLVGGALGAAGQIGAMNKASDALAQRAELRATQVGREYGGTRS